MLLQDFVRNQAQVRTVRGGYYACRVSPLLLVLDGNSLLHRAYHAAATGRTLDGDGRAVWALKGLVTNIAGTAARLRPDAVLVGFDCPEESVRKADYPHYKAQRADKPADLAEQIVAAPALLDAAGFSTVLARAYEADDVLASAAAHASRTGWRSVLVTSDRDAFALIDASTSVFRIRNGGLDQASLVTASTLAAVCGVEPHQYRDYAALRGDPSDNLPGVRGFGPSTAARLLAEFGTIEAAWHALDSGAGDAVRAAVGDLAAAHLHTAQARATVDRNRRLMRMRADLAIPDLDTARVPMDRARMREVLADRGIYLGPSLWALTGGSPPEEIPPLPPRARRGQRATRAHCEGQLSLF
jgi:5'-3' exonuclease